MKKKSSYATNKKTTSQIPPSRITKGIKESLLFVFFAMSVFLIISLYSYSSTDPAWSHSISTSLQQQTQNLGGIIGAYFADISYYLFGYMAYFIPIIFAVTGWILYKERSDNDKFHGLHFSLRGFGFLLTFLSGCGIFTMHFMQPTIKLPSDIGAGGILGQVVSQQLQIWFSFVGSTLLLLTLFLVGITLFSHLSWLRLMDNTGKWSVHILSYGFRKFKQLFSALKSKPVDEDKLSSPQIQKRPLISNIDSRNPDDVNVEEKDEGKNIDKDTLTDKTTFATKLKNKLSAHISAQNTQQVDKDNELASANEKIEPVFDKISRSSQLKTGLKETTELLQQTKQELSSTEDIQNPPIEVTEPKETKKPIKIQTADHQVETSDRVQRESQKQLFQHDTLDGLPALTLLDPPVHSTNTTSAEELEILSRRIEQKLADYNMVVEVVAVQQGPVITRFELQLAPGIKVSQLTNLSKDLARALLVISIRVVEVIAGKSTVGIEIPNEHRAIVSFFEVLNSAAYGNSKALLPLGLGDDISGQPVVADLAKMPHLLVAGTTGSGKSVGVNSMILSLLFHSNPDELRLIMVDPKMLELSIYEGIPHLLCPVVTDMMEAANALRWCVAEMERRYKLMSALGVRNIAGYRQQYERNLHTFIFLLLKSL